MRRSAAILARWSSRETARTVATAAHQSRPTTARSGPHRPAYSVSERMVLRAAYGINYSRRGAVGGRAGARNGTGTLGFSANASFPSAERLRPGLQLERRRAGLCRHHRSSTRAQHRLRDRPRNRRQVTYGDSEIGGRPPRYQNWNAGVQYALRSSPSAPPMRAAAAIFLGGSGRGFYANQIDPQYLALGNLLTQPATPAKSRPPRRSCRASRYPIRLLRHHFADAAAVPTVLGGHRRLRQRGGIHLPLAAAHSREAEIRRRPDR